MTFYCSYHGLQSLYTVSTVYGRQIVFCRTIEFHYQSIKVQVEKFNAQKPTFARL